MISKGRILVSVSGEPMSLGEAVSLRLREISLRDAAAGLECSHDAVRRIARGEHVPRGDLLLRLLFFVGAEAVWLAESKVARFKLSC